MKSLMFCVLSLGILIVGGALPRSQASTDAIPRKNPAALLEKASKEEKDERSKNS